MIASIRRFMIALRIVLAVCLGLAISGGGASAGSPTLVAQPGVTAPGSIPELARALKYDVNLIYEYVYTNIEYSPTWGLKKGALGTLLDGSGNDFDQAALLVALLRESGYTASYAYGRIELTATEAGDFYGVAVDNFCPLYWLFRVGGFPVPNITDCNFAFSTVNLRHVWVLVTGGSLGATTYALDPSYKLYRSAAGVGDLAPILGYNQAAFLNSATSGATIVPGLSIQNLNKANVASALQGYANNLVNDIRAKNPRATTRDIIGGNYIKPLTQPYALPTSLSYQDGAPDIWTGNVRDEYRTTLRIQLGSIDKTYFADELYGHRLSVVYDANLQPTLYLDGVAQGTGGPGVATISYIVDFPFCVASSPNCLFTFQNAVKATAGSTYAIVAGWDFTGRGMVEFHRRQLQANRAAGNADGSEAVLGEALNMVGYAWLAQLSANNAVTDRLVQSSVVTHCAIGVAAQVGGPYIDIPGVYVGFASRTNDLARGEIAFFTGTGAASAFEWGTLEQNLAGSGVGAVSTVKLIDIANAQGDVLYDATQANWTSVKNQLIQYDPADLAALDNYIDNLGYRAILPRHGNLTEGVWTGAGYIVIASSASRIGYIISSNLKGGYTTVNLPPGETVEDVSVYSPYIFPPAQFTGTDPIDLSSGAFLYDRQDLSLGSADFPIGLAFGRSYSSNNLYAKGPLGPGWSHNLSITALASSDGLKGLGQDSPIDGAAAIAAIYVAQDLFSDANKPFDKVLIATLVQRWMMDRLINNTVNVTTGSQAEQFVKLADGSYHPQPASSSRLSLDGNTYTLTYKDATTLRFDANGNLSTWLVPSGLTATFSYDASTPPLPTGVSNGLGRTLTLAYNDAKQLTAVSDNTGRSVTYTYDATGNLASVVDALGFTTAFGYTPASGPAPAGLLSEIFYPGRPGNAFVTNRYDTLGRVATQTNANGATWGYFFAGYRSEEVDPNSTRHVLYYNPRGKAQFDIRDYDGLNLLTKMTYDGLDRLSTVTLPEGGATVYLYDTTVNPWANNISTMIRVTKDTSATVSTSYVYDPTFNKPIEITLPPPVPEPPHPPPCLTCQFTTVTYDPANGNVASVVPDSKRIAPRTSYTYTSLGQVASITDPLGTVTTYSYDEAGNRLSMIEDAGPGRLNRTTLYGYNERGDLVSLTDPNGNVTRSEYDAGRRLVTTTSPGTSAAPGGIVTTNSYDADGRLLQVEQSSSGTVLRTTSATWTPTGKLETATDAKGNVTRYDYDLLDRQVTLTDAMGRVAKFTYDNVSRPLQTSNPEIRKPALPAEVAPLLTQSWTPDGKLASLTDANDSTTSFEYDGFNRLKKTTYPDPVSGLAGTTEEYKYDDVDNVTERKTRAGATITFGYDTLYRLITKTPPSGAGSEVTYAYDLAGRQTRVSDTSAPITAAVPPGGSTVTYGTTYTYDALNRPTKVEWDPAPTVTPPAAGTLVTFGHSYDKTNRRIGQTVDDNTWLAYPAGAPSTTSYTPDKLNRYSAVTGLTPSYDNNGNMTGDGTYTYGYDAENRMVSAGGAGNNSTYSYDGRGWRKSRTVNGTTTISVTDTGNREVLEYDGATGAVLRWYAFGLGSNDVLNQISVPGSTRSALVSDIQGSIIGTFNSTGVLGKSTYLTYGGSSAAANPFGYTGQRFDSESGGLYYYRARHYSPQLGRFLQTDPIGYSAGSNLYAYVHNDPLNRSDAFGLCDRAQGCGGSSNVILAGGLAVPAPSVGDILIRGGAAVGSSIMIGVAGVGAVICILLCPTPIGPEPSILMNQQSPSINPQSVVGKTPAEIDQLAKDSGLVPKGPDPMSGKGAYVDPLTGKQRILIHPGDGHAHVNNPAGERLGPNGEVVAPESPEAHLPIGN